MEHHPDTEVIMVEYLKMGDSYWGDTWSHDHNYALYGDRLHWTVVRPPIVSINTGLFEDQGTCVVVVVEYPDGSRGSRLWPKDASVRVRRPYAEGGEAA